MDGTQLNSLQSVENEITTGDTERRSGKHTWPWALIKFLDFERGRLLEVGAYSRLGAY